MYKFVPTTEEHIREFVDDLRDHDRESINSFSIDAIEVTLIEDIGKAKESWTAIAPDGIVVIFGINCASPLTNKARVWLLTTNLVDKYKKSFLKGTRIALDYWSNKYDVLETWVDADYEMSIRWLKWAGFEIKEAAPFGADGRTFYRVEMRK